MRIKPKLLFGLIFLALTMNACSQPEDCQKFRNGNFKMTFHGHTIIIKRHEGIQTETTDFSHKTLYVEWVDDCTYILRPTEETIRNSPKRPKGAFVKVEITKVNDNSYMQTSTTNFSDDVLTAEIFRIK